MGDAFLLNPADYSDPFARCPDCGGCGMVPVEPDDDAPCKRCDGSGRVLRSTLTADEQADLDSGQEEYPPDAC